MSTKMLNPNTTIVVIAADRVANPLAPSASELNGTSAKNISCAITRGYTLNPTDSDTDDTASICDTGNVQTRLFDNYEGELTMFRDANAADGTSVFNIAFNYFREPDQTFYVYRRVGKKSNTVFADGDPLEGFLFMNDRLRSVDGGDSGPVQFTVPLLAQGTYTGYIYVGSVAVPTLTTVTPATAALAGGTVHTLTGTGFGSANKVKVGTTVVPATVVSGTKITFTAPANGAGSKTIVVSNPAGDSTGTTAITYS